MSPRGDATQTKVHYKGKDDDFVIFVESEKDVNDWKSDKTVPLAQVVNGWKVFVTHKHGNQGILDTASNASLDNEFGTHKEEEVVKKILEQGSVQSVEDKGRVGDTNQSKGASTAHGYGGSVA